MEITELVNYILEDTPCVSKEKWIRAIESSIRFRDFVYEYRGKIRKKIKDTNSEKEDIVDVLAELEIAYLLLQVDHFKNVAYESFGRSEPNPDLNVINDSPEMSFNIEVKRIRMTDLERRFDAWKRDMYQQVRITPSGLGFSIAIHDSGDSREFVNQLEEKRITILAQIKKTIEEAKKDIPFGDSRQYTVPGLENTLTFELSNEHGGLAADYTEPLGGVFPVFGTTKEYRKFGDILCDPENLNQMRPREINVLAITTASEIFSIGDRLNQAIQSITNQDEEFFQKHRFKDVNDFSDRFRRVSGVLFRSTLVGDGYRNLLWINAAAECAIPQNIAQALRTMDYPEGSDYDSLIKIRR